MPDCRITCGLLLMKRPLNIDTYLVLAHPTSEGSLGASRLEYGLRACDPSLYSDRPEEQSDLPEVPRTGHLE